MPLPPPQLSIPAVDHSREPTLRAQLDAQARPPGSLGRFEDLAVQLALLGIERPLDRATLLLFAGDHGLVTEGVSTYPQAVTAAIVTTLLAGRASANALARALGAELRVVDVGVAGDLPDDPGLIRRNVRRGTGNAAR
ncbi:MAG: nicotinate-nucleotide--dimethylbenzimidazole phosphoribosyltransferase, partial [Methylobacteriaceae bacterium]|nr:nicotinate-nucleotide--dimethylbenzimidazole phosphoribosyltransferase [Methylobacteriaceae bacterium]